MKKYFNYQVKKALAVKSLITIEWLDMSYGFQSPDEVHNFCEFAYCDKGSIICNINEEQTSLCQEEFMLILPGTRHHYSAVKKDSANVFIVCFQSSSELLRIMEGKVKLDNDLKLIISEILSESKKAFKFPFRKKLQLLDKPIFGAQQLIECKIEELLIKMTRRKLNESDDIKFVMSNVEFENNIVNDIIAFLNEKLYDRITLQTVSETTYYSKTYINAIFKKNTGRSIMNYYAYLKIQEAKKLINEGKSSSAISEALCFENPNYYAKVFKRVEGLTPSEYKKTIKV
ncbi:MAG: helix-turn-helix transcriptional regulator [Clostridia bacterium]|nr:helix-turn-helix transcriptional regulator [Clostridia bacterium]